MKKLNQEEFEKRCKEIYGDRFTFEKAVYKNDATRVTLFDTLKNQYVKLLPGNIYKGRVMTKNKRYNTENFIKWSKEIFGDLFTYEKTVCNKSSDYVIITCKKHGDFKKKAYAHINQKQGCPFCSDNFRTKEMIIKESKEVFGDEYDYSLVEDALPNTKIKIICPKHGVFEKTPYEHINKKIGCPYCAKEKRRKSLDDFIKGANLIDRNIDIIDNYESMSKPLKFKCKNCGYEWETLPSKIQAGEGCPKCANKIKPTKEEIIKKAREIHGEKYDYSLVNMEEATNENHYKIKIICPEHGIFEQPYHSHLNGASCPLCHESKLERKTRLMLENNSIKYIPYWKTNDLKNTLPLSLDFYLPEYNIGIECQGRFHFEPINALGGIEAYNKQHENDIIKNNFCKEHNIKLLYYTEDDYDNFLGEKLYKNTDDILKEIKFVT